MKDLSNNRFGSLISLFRSKTNNQKWVCRCDCGNELEVFTNNLTRGNTRSCGCLKKDQCGTKNPQWNGFEEISSTKYSEYKRNAKRRNIQFDISIQEMWNVFLNQNKKCALTGEPISFQKNTRDSNSTASLDRIDSKKGYVIGNVRWILKDLNYMKLDFSDEHFIDLCCKVVKFKQRGGSLIG